MGLRDPPERGLRHSYRATLFHLYSPLAEVMNLLVLTHLFTYKLDPVYTYYNE